MLKRKEYIKTVRRPYPPLFVSIILEGSATPEHYKAVVDEPFSIQNMCHVDGWWWYSKAEESEEIMHTLNIPLDGNYHKIEERKLVQTTDITKHVKKFEFLKSRYGKIDPYTLEEARAKREKLLDEKFLEKYSEEKRWVREGDILVTPMTNPHMVPIMKKAAAFVTDEGGITCHAAILSREMKKPCIIGTKIATQVLKDGDRVEVDAEKGVVRKI